MHDLTGFQRDVLYIVAGHDGSKGLAIKDHIDRYHGFTMNHGRLYINLDKLVEKGLIDKGQLDERTNSYTITDAGRQAIRERKQWEERILANAELTAEA